MPHFTYLNYRLNSISIYDLAECDCHIIFNFQYVYFYLLDYAIIFRQNNAQHLNGAWQPNDNAISHESKNEY